MPEVNSCRLAKTVTTLGARSDGGVGQYLHDKEHHRVMVVLTKVSKRLPPYDTVVVMEVSRDYESNISHEPIVTSNQTLHALGYHVVTKKEVLHGV